MTNIRPNHHPDTPREGVNLSESKVAPGNSRRVTELPKGHSSDRDLERQAKQFEEFLSKNEREPSELPVPNLNGLGDRILDQLQIDSQPKSGGDVVETIGTLVDRLLVSAGPVTQDSKVRFRIKEPPFSGLEVEVSRGGGNLKVVLLPVNAAMQALLLQTQGTLAAELRRMFPDEEVSVRTKGSETEEEDLLRQ